MRQIFAFVGELSAVGALLSLLFWLLLPLSRRAFSAAWHRGALCVLLAFFAVPAGALLRRTAAMPVLWFADKSGEWGAVFPTPLQQNFLGGPAVSMDAAPQLQKMIFGGLSALWLVVAIGLFVHRVLLLVRFHRCLKQQSCPAPQSLQTILEEEAKMLGISQPICLCVNSSVPTPMLVGFIQNIIYIPNIQMSASKFRLVLRHELIHVRQKDLWVKWIGIVLCSVHWFNPCIWLLMKQLDSWMEKACDAAVVADMEPAQRRAYGEVILAALANARNAKSKGLYAAFSSNKNQVKERLSAMLHAKKHTKRIGALSLFVLATLVVVGTLLGAAAHQTELVSPSVPEQVEPLAKKLDASAPAAEEPQQEEASFVWPVPKSAFVSANMDAYPGHTGIDIAATKDTEIVAAAAGTVVWAEKATSGYGNHILVDHGGGYQTLYAQCNQLLASKGDAVSAGQVIATVGRSGNATGNHLHFELLLNEAFLNPEDYVTSPESAKN